MPPRGEHSRAELRALILSAAGEIAEAEGPRGLTARAIAGRIGYSPGTLYNVLADLDDVVLQLNADTLDALHARLADVRRAGVPACRRPTCWRWLVPMSASRGSGPGAGTWCSSMSCRRAATCPNASRIGSRRCWRWSRRRWRRSSRRARRASAIMRRAFSGRRPRASQCAQKARITSGGRNHPDSCRFDLVAGRRFVRVTGWIEAL